MRRMRWITCLWPGLPQLWAYGSWGGLALAIGTGVVLDLLLLGSFGWSELVGPSMRSTLWAAFGVCWVMAAAWSARQCLRWMAAGSVSPREDPFNEALDYYLKGDYYQVEQILEGLLQRNLRDVDARLMLATVMRRTGRPSDAKRELDTLAKFEGADKWVVEIQRERKLLAEAKTCKSVAA